ncbi:hypothetical protein P691DRAFT_780689 [Macrolepiota fuliginosa MF-IS2]|uniref:Uncharacterized protein n=1 Tax=Macrolepiota fuliginosa MF-IS2 TaxID=1400762 RepID=A0A9P6BV10_9AGAR|nr:hypothetical protein P691DRAFT_780689 [Macrolepiota fuliginosa MF-IS2]
MLRVNAIWDHNLKVTVMLVLAITVEIILATLRTIIVGVVQHDIILSGLPLHGCYIGEISSSSVHLEGSIEIALWVSQSVNIGFELLLILVKLVQALKQVKNTGNTFYERLLHIKGFMPVIYVFYRDGMLAVFPIFVINILSFVQVMQTEVVADEVIPKLPDMGGWTLLVYYFCGTRIILNLRKADCKITESIHSLKGGTSLRFNHDTQEDNDEGTAEGAAEDGEILEEIHH